MKPQCIAVLNHLKRKGPLTHRDAERRLGVARLGARVWDLKRAGIDIDSELVWKRTRYGSARVARYSLA